MAPHHMHFPKMQRLPLKERVSWCEATNVKRMEAAGIRLGKTQCKSCVTNQEVFR
jgi:hypothetical protein